MNRRDILRDLVAVPLLGGIAGRCLGDDPSDPLANHRVKIRTQELTAVIGDNESDPFGEPYRFGPPYRPIEQVPHRAGYNGLWSLSSRHRPENLFHPYGSGMNFECIFDGHVGSPDQTRTLEPRSAPMEFQLVDERTVRLHQPPTPFWGLESWTEITVREPYYIDLSFECMPTRKTWHNNWLGLFWANYIYQPVWDDAWPFVLGEDHRPIRLSREASTTIRSGDPLELAGGATSYVASNGKVRCWEPLLWGTQRGMLILLMLNSQHRLGFLANAQHLGPKETHKPGPDTNVAWDWHMTVIEPQLQKRYALRARLAYTKYEDEGQPMREFEKWLHG